MTDIFISVGRTSAREEEDFLHAVEGVLRANEFSPRTIGSADLAVENPFEKILKVMKKCSGIIVIASGRLVFERGVEFPKSIEKPVLPEVYLPTVWIQIEAAMAYTLHVPMLVIAESNLRPDGFLEREYDWQILRWDTLVPKRLNSADFKSAFEIWKDEVATFEKLQQF